MIAYTGFTGTSPTYSCPCCGTEGFSSPVRCGGMAYTDSTANTSGWIRYNDNSPIFEEEETFDFSEDWALIERKLESREQVKCPTLAEEPKWSKKQDVVGKPVLFNRMLLSKSGKLPKRARQRLKHRRV